MIKLACIIEVPDADTLGEAQDKLDTFREAVLPEFIYGLSIYRASGRELLEDDVWFSNNIKDMTDETAQKCSGGS